MTGSNLLTAAGLIYDIVGAILIAQAIVFSRHTILVLQARRGGQFSTANLALFSALEDQRHDARVGFILLVGGFLLQLAAALGYALPVDWLPGSVLSVPLFTVLVGWYFLRKRLAASRRDRLAGSFEGLERLNFLNYYNDPNESK